MIDIKEDLRQWFINFLIIKSSGKGLKSKYTLNQKLASELHKVITKKFQQRNVCLSLIDNILSADFADIQLISRYNKRIRFLLCAIDVHSKYAWVIPLKHQKGETITKAFQKM